MRQVINVFGLIFSLALTLSGGAILFQISGIAVLVAGTLIAMIGLMSVGIFLARILSYIDNRKELVPDCSTR